MSSYPKSLDFSSLDPMAVAANSQMVVSLPESSRIANPDDISRIRVSTGMAGAYLNCSKSFLKFTVVNTTTYPLESATNKDWTGKVMSPLVLDLSAMSCIKKIEWYSSSNLLESINNYNVLSAIMIDTQMSSEATHTSGDILGLAGDGFKNSTYFSLVRAAGARATSNNAMPFTAAGPPITGFTPFWFEPGAPLPSDPSTNLFAGLNVIVNDGGGTATAIANNNVLETSAASPAAAAGALNYGNAQLGLVQIDAPDGWTFQRAAGNIPANAGLLGGANQLRGLHENLGANGTDLRISRVGPVIPFGSKLTVCLPLLSMFGTLSCRMYPIHALSSPLMLHIYWDSLVNVQCLRWTPGHTNISHNFASLPAANLSSGSRVVGSSTYMNWGYQITDIEYHANVVTLSGEAQAVIDQMTGGVYQISTSSYRHYSNTIPAGSTQNEILVPARFSSLKSLFHCLRPQTNLNNASHFSISERIKNYFTRAQLRIGSALYPSQPIEMTNNYYQATPVPGTSSAFSSGPTGSAPQAYSLLINALGSSINTLNIPCNMNGEVYSNNTGGLPISTDGSYYISSHCGSTAGFVLGFDVESFGPSDTCSGPLSAGLNTLGISIYLQLSVDAINLGTSTISASPFDSTMVVACQVDSFAHFDLVATVAGGSMSVRF